MNSSDNIINIPCNQNYAHRKALVIDIETYSWKSRQAAKNGRHVDAQKYSQIVAELKRQLAGLKQS